MTRITKKEVLRVARMAHIELLEEEIEIMQKHLEAVLSYAARVQDIAKDADELPLKNSNVEREDIAVTADSDAILNQGPEHEDHYFVVPAIIETTE